MKKFEYKRECVSAQQFEILMNEFGDEGWELVVYSGGYAFLKREVQPIKASSKQLLQESQKSYEDR
jgi:hypothetical protein